MHWVCNSIFFLSLTVQKTEIMTQKTTKRIIYTTTPFILLLVGLMTFQSCIKDNFEFDKLKAFEWNPDLAVPLVHSSFTMSNVLGIDKDSLTKGFLKIDSDDALSIIYSSSVTSATATASFTDSVKINLFSSALKAGILELVDPKVRLTTYNSFGYPIKAHITKLYARRGDSTYQIPLSVPFFAAVATPTAGQQGQAVTAETLFNSGNSFAKDVFKKKTKYVTYAVDFTPDSIPTSPLFYLNNANVKLKVDVEFPLYGRSLAFTVFDTIPNFTIAQALNNQVESAIFRVYNANGFPVQVGFQVYFTDSLYNVLDSLFLDPNILRAASVNNVGRVSVPTETTKDVVLTKDILKNLTTTQSIVVKAVITTTNSGATDVKIYNDYRIDLKLGMQVKLAMKL
jgi:hypothetical protein